MRWGLMQEEVRMLYVDGIEMRMRMRMRMRIRPRWDAYYYRYCLNLYIWDEINLGTIHRVKAKVK